MSFDVIRRAATALVILVLIPVHAVYAKFEVAPGGVVVLGPPINGQVKDATSERGGAVALSETKGPNPQTTLIYLPPAGARELEDKVTYKIGDAPQMPIEISVRPRAPTLDSPNIYDASFKAIFVLFILAVLVENGLALLFRWRPFLSYFDSRSMNALVAFIFSLALVLFFNLDIANQLIGIYTDTQRTVELAGWKGLPGTLLTAMIVAGGSAGVNKMFQAFGFRPSSVEEQPPPPQLDEQHAWVAVTLLRDKAVGTVAVWINDAVAGSIPGSSPRNKFWRFFVRDKGRYPQTAGRPVDSDAQYAIELKGHDKDGKELSSSWGPYKIGKRAVVDIELKL